MYSGDAPLAQNLAALLENQTARWVILLSSAFLVLFANAHQSRLYGDALIYAGEARLIADSGEYATLRFGHELNHHGPLLFWLTAAAIKIFGPTPFAASFFSRLFGVGCIILTVWLGSYLFGKNTGWLAAIALVTGYTFVRNTTTLRMDSALTFGVLLAMVGFSAARNHGDRRYFMSASRSLFWQNRCPDSCRCFSHRFTRCSREIFPGRGKDRLDAGSTGRLYFSCRLLGGPIWPCNTAAKCLLSI